MNLKGNKMATQIRTLILYESDFNEKVLWDKLVEYVNNDPFASKLVLDVTGVPLKDRYVSNNGLHDRRAGRDPEYDDELLFSNVMKTLKARKLT